MPLPCFMMIDNVVVMVEKKKNLLQVYLFMFSKQFLALAWLCVRIPACHAKCLNQFRLEPMNLICNLRNFSLATSDAYANTRIYAQLAFKQRRVETFHSITSTRNMCMYS